jgi:hypothetical protein
MCRLQRTFLATGVRFVDMPLLTASATRSHCASQDRIAEGLLLGCALDHHLRLGTFCVKEAKLGV